jgi:hypothetical protein
MNAVCTAISDETLLYEISIPWSVLKFANGRPGDSFRIAIIVNDNDGNGRKGWQVFHANLGKLAGPEFFSQYSLGK